MVGLPFFLLLLAFPYKIESKGKHKPITVLAIIAIFAFMYLLSQFLFFRVDSNSGSYILNFYTFGILPAFFKWYMPLTSLFFHINFWHLFFNILFLWLYGGCMERKIGFLPFTALFIIFSYAATFGYMFMLPDYLNHITSIGASAAIAGTMGFVLLTEPFSKVIFFTIIRPNKFSIPAFIILIIWFIFQMFSGYNNIEIESDGVNHWAHIYGFISGVVCGIIYRYLFFAAEDVARIRAASDMKNVIENYYNNDFNTARIKLNEIIQNEKESSDIEEIENVRLMFIENNKTAAADICRKLFEKYLKEDKDESFIQLFAVLQKYYPEKITEDMYKAASMYYKKNNKYLYSLWYRLKQFNTIAYFETRERIIFTISDLLINKMNQYNLGKVILEFYIKNFPKGVMIKESEFLYRQLLKKIDKEQRNG